MEEFSFAKLLLMFIHYDLKNHELLEYQVRSYYRLMHKTDRQYKCEKIMLEFFKSNAGIKKENCFVNIWRNCKHKSKLFSERRTREAFPFILIYGPGLTASLQVKILPRLYERIMVLVKHSK